jgi:hypothetical protein
MGRGYPRGTYPFGDGTPLRRLALLAGVADLLDADGASGDSRTVLQVVAQVDQVVGASCKVEF